MADQNSGDDAAPQYETKDLPHGYAPATVPFSDTTHLDRGETGAVPEPTPAVSPSPDTATDGGEKKSTTTTARKATPANKDS